jgi:hypothetical protein
MLSAVKIVGSIYFFCFFRARWAFMNGIRTRMLIAAAVFILLGIGISIVVAAAGIGAAGHGTLLVPNSDGNQVRRQFSFSARQGADGRVSGNAILHNPAFTGENGQNYMLHVDITCMKVYGNTAVFGGTTRKTNDPNLIGTVFFSVQDNGEPGKGSDRISLAYFGDGAEDPQGCLTVTPDTFPLVPIDEGNIQVK